ncbi:MAG: prepilin-type N-terminal cleavage/methylation domain-containing protein, partial [Clostridiales Family XIII bacterium]|nr:prepilin-type N-terminal cleavage/methylation domain-containing protein [Clostridiales Family XIII bacterium]
KAGFTLVELIVALAISAVVIGAAAAFLIYGSNFLASAQIKAEDKSLAEESADFVKNRLLYSGSITVVRSTRPPVGTSGGEILFIGNADGSEIANNGQLYYMRADDNSAVNAFGTGKYRNNSLAMSYRAIVTTDPATGKTDKVFEITISTIRKGKAVYHYTKTFTLYEAAPTAEPSENMSITSWSSDEDFDVSMATYYIMLNPTATGYVTAGLLAHFDAIDNDWDGANGQALHNPKLTTKWKDISGNGNDMDLIFTNNSAPVRDQSIYFDGAGDYGRIPQLDLRHGPYTEGMDYGVTVEVCFRQANTKIAGMLFEYSTDWNSQPSGFGVYLNSISSGYSDSNTVHTNMGRPNTTRPINYKWSNQSAVFTTHTNYYQMVNGKPCRVVWIDGAMTGLIATGSGTAVQSYPFNYNGATKDFDPQPFFAASRNGGYNYQGEISSIRIYSRMLTDAEVLQNSIEDRARFGF